MRTSRLVVLALGTLLPLELCAGPGPVLEAAPPPRDPAETAAAVEALLPAVMPRVLALRRQIHRHPELANRETLTARLVAARLREIGVDQVREGIALTGVVAEIRGSSPGPVVLFRADMDALPLTETSGLSYASEVPGVMHACGHDAHTAILLGVAEVLVRLRDRLRGRVRLLFQPAEEGAPAGGAAARRG